MAEYTQAYQSYTLTHTQRIADRMDQMTIILVSVNPCQNTLPIEVQLLY